MKIILQDDILYTGGYVKIATEDKSPSAFVDEVNKKLGDYWVSTGRERNMENAMFEVLAEMYDKFTHLQDKQ